MQENDRENLKLLREGDPSTSANGSRRRVLVGVLVVVAVALGAVAILVLGRLGAY